MTLDQFRCFKIVRPLAILSCPLIGCTMQEVIRLPHEILPSILIG